MKISLKQAHTAVLFEATNSRGHTVAIEGAEDIGGSGSAPSPTEYLLMSHAGCTAIDVADLLKKMRQPLRHLEVESHGHLEANQIPRVFTTIHLHFKLFGDIQIRKAEKAISMSLNQYCTVSKMIDRIAHITYSFEIITNPVPHNDASA